MPHGSTNPPPPPPDGSDDAPENETGSESGNGS